MKKLLLLIPIALLLQVSCSKDLHERTEAFGPLNPLKTDIDAGGWTPILLSAPTDVEVPAPAATTSPDYATQLSEIKSWQARLSQSDRAVIDYWSAGAVLRWNEILRELVAKHNLPPYQNDDGTYPAPNPANPLAYPQFPFSNPPYAARAYAYVSAAQYDALVAAWHYKKRYNRPAPYAVDNHLPVLVSRSELPSYPSEDATVVGVTVELLKLLFPGDQDLIQQKAEEHKRARIMAGANVRSDIEAGEALGRLVAQKFVARARTDGAGQAGGKPADWAAMEKACLDNGETPWYSQESPVRPPMLPLFGRVMTFLFDSATARSLRPGPPPSVHGEQMKRELDEVYQLTQSPTRERLRIINYWADGVGTYTPPGHWNDIAATDFAQRQYSEVRWARNMALLNMALMDAAIVCWDTKMCYYNPRPSQLNPAIKTLTGLPNFPSYISGHSTFSSAAATVLGYLVPERKDAYEAMANEATLSRLYGGIHYRSDCEAGVQVGQNIGAYAVQRARTDGAD